MKARRDSYLNISRSEALSSLYRPNTKLENGQS